MKSLLTTLLCCLLCGSWLSAQNLALCLDRNQEDFVQLLTAGTPLAGDPATFTVECWLNNRNTSLTQFRRLFSFGGPGTRIEVGELAGQLTYFINSGSVASVAPLPANTWTHLALVRNGSQLEFYLDCTLVGTATLAASTTFTIDFFRLGRWPGGFANNADWDGFVDEIRLWSTARTVTDICSHQYCPLSCNESGLVSHWTFDNDGAVAFGNNTGLTQVLDCSPNGNHGTLTNFVLNSTCSNWVANAAPVVSPALHDLTLDIRDYPYRNVSLTGICEGEPIHICLDDSGQTPGPYANVSVQWEFSDDGGTSWNPVGTPSFQDFCFPVQPGEIQVPCPGNTDGFVNRKYRAISTATGPNGNQCDYVSTEYDLQICCPIGGANLTVQPSGPFCEGDVVNFQVDLNPNDPFVATPGPNVTIDWFFDGAALPAFANQTSFNFGPWTAPFPPLGVPGSYCFQAEVRNCQGKLATFEQCVTVDPQPVCGTIDAFPFGAPQNLTPVSTNPLVYEICPGNDAVVAIDLPFQYCIPEWQYTFTDPATGSPTWVSMGTSNSQQNTNILPSHLWPASATSIYYRIQCNPLSMPSGCDPCFSNYVEIRLIPAPATPLIAGSNQECLEDMPTSLSISNPNTGLTYTWYHDGLVFGNGTSINALESGCYWVEATDGCHTAVSAQHCIEVCETIARLSCPLVPNECACLGDPITLTACGSEHTCSGNSGSSLQYEWFIDGVSQGPASAVCDLTHTPPAAGSTYVVTVKDPVTGCVGTATRTVVPCDKNQ